jgi:hypothetical protein
MRMKPNLQARGAEVRTIDYYRSDAGYETRCADYLAQMLWRSSEKPWDVYTGRGEPSWPAFWFYDIRSDQMIWIECMVLTHLKDYARAYPDRLNAAAKALIDG